MQVFGIPEAGSAPGRECESSDRRSCQRAHSDRIGALGIRNVPLVQVIVIDAVSGHHHIFNCKSMWWLNIKTN